jgi:hypothetical protein
MCKVNCQALKQDPGVDRHASCSVVWRFTIAKAR